MALHDVDKSVGERNNPMPNHVDRLNSGSIKAHKTVSTHYNAGADTNPGFIQMRNKQIIANDGTNPIGLYGYNAALKSWGFFLTKTGTDVTTNTNLSNFIFNSNQDIFKVAADPSGTLSLSFGSNSSGTSGTFTAYSTNTLQLEHNLGIVPTIAPQLLDTNTGFYMPVSNGSIIRGPALVTNSSGIVGLGLYSWNIWADTSNVYIRGMVSGGGGTSSSGYTIGSISLGNFSFKVYCLQETAN